MLWSDEILKEIQKQEDIITNPDSNRYDIENAKTEMERLTETYIKKTKPVSKTPPINKIGKHEYSRSGELIGFWLDDLNKKSPN